MNGILGFKLGEKRLLLGNYKFVRVTIIEIKKNVVTQVKTKEKDNYDALQLGIYDDRDNFKQIKSLNKSEIGHLKKINNFKIALTKEIRDMKGYKIGDYLNVTELFKSGELIRATTLKSKGKGFSGTIKRFNFKKGPMSHGSGFHRGMGSTGSIDSNRVFKGKKMPGRLGGKKVTKNLQILDINQNLNYIILKGSVPGPKKGLLIIRSFKIKRMSKNFIPLFKNK